MSGRKGMKHYKVETKKEAAVHVWCWKSICRIQLWQLGWESVKPNGSKPGSECIDEKENFRSISQSGDR